MLTAASPPPATIYTGPRYTTGLYPSFEPGYEDLICLFPDAHNSSV